MRHFLRFSILCLMLLAAVPCLAKNWNGIFPLHTTRAAVLGLLGKPLKDKTDGKEYFEIDNQTVKIRWIRPDCYSEGVIEEEKFLNDDSLVYQVSVFPKEPLKSIDIYTAGDTKKPAPIPGFYWSTYQYSCISSLAGYFSCSASNVTDGFGYSNSKRGYTALYFFPTDEENKAWKEILKPCTSSENEK